MAWHLEDRSGPYGAPWEGRDSTVWVWELYRDDQSRRVVVEVSGTAMAVADEFLPAVTAEAKQTNGRSEIEKILEQPEPPRRISLGTTGYLDAPALRPDAVLVDRRSFSALANPSRRRQLRSADRQKPSNRIASYCVEPG